MGGVHTELRLPRRRRGQRPVQPTAVQAVVLFLREVLGGVALGLCAALLMRWMLTLQVLLVIAENKQVLSCQN